MIVVYTAYDAVSNLLAGCARGLLEQARGVGRRVTHLLEPPTGSTQASIQAILKAHQGPLFFFGHGTPIGLLSQEQVSAIDRSCGHLLQNRLVCAICCHSANSLAHPADQHDVTVLGFAGKLQVAVSKDKKECLAPYDAYVMACVLDGLKELLEGKPVSSARQRMQDEFFRVDEDLNKGLALDMTTARAYAFAFYENGYAVTLLGDANRCLEPLPKDV